MVEGEFLSALGCAGLEEQWGALRSGDGERLTGNGEELAIVVDVAHLIRVDEDVGVGIGLERVRSDRALEQLVHDLHELIGPVVALIVRDLALEPEVAGSGVDIAGDDIPGDSTVGEVIEGGQGAGEQVGLLVGHRGGHAESQRLRGRGHGRDCDEGVEQRELHSPAVRDVGVAAVHVVDAEDVGEEERGESSVFEGLGQVGPEGQLSELLDP